MERRRETEVWDSEGRGGKRGQRGLVHEWRGRGLSGVREERTANKYSTSVLGWLDQVGRCIV